MTDPDALRVEHTPKEWTGITVDGRAAVSCAACYQRWPCDVARLRASLDDLRPYLRHDLRCDVYKTKQVFETPYGIWVRVVKLNLTCTCGLTELEAAAYPEETDRD